ncbi:hypothetical protein KJ853_00500 [Patescibacteria group bacterium]|nr:hypothetical protein [Patescibacteria group bacterium]
MEKEYICPRCGAIGTRNSLAKPNFKCSQCGLVENWFWRKELMNLDDPVEGQLAMEIYAGMCGYKEIKNE